MSAPMYGSISAPVAAANASTAAGASRRSLLLQLALTGGAIVAAGAVAALVPSAELRDHDLARLLRLMASLKGAMVVAGVAALHWRFRRFVPAPRAIAYVSLAWLAAGSVTTMWKLSAIAPAAIALHVAGAALLVLAFTDRDFIPA